MNDPTWWQWVLFIALVGSIYLLIGIGRGWLIRAIQITIVMAVVLSNAYWPWTSNLYLPGLFGVAAAWLVTVLPLMLWDRLRPRQPLATAIPPPDPKPRPAPFEVTQEYIDAALSSPSTAISGRNTGVGSGEESLSDGAGKGAAVRPGHRLNAPHKRLTGRTLGREDSD